MPDDLDAVRVRFTSILLSAPCQKVDFWCGGLHVNGAGLAVIAHALSAGGTAGKGIGISVEKLGDYAAAAYDYQRDAFLISTADWAKEDAFERLAVVHEAIHALRDSFGKRLIYEGRPFRPRAATDEAAAYVGGCLYNIYVQREAGGTAAEKPAWLAARKSPTHAVAYGVALRQAAKPPGSAMDRADLSLLFRTTTTSSRRFGNPLPRFNDWDGFPT